MTSGKVVPPSNSNGNGAAPTVDRLSSLLERFRVRATLFHSGPLCGTNALEARPDRGFLHVLRRGTLTVRHPQGTALPRVLRVHEPTLLLYPRPLRHVVVTPPRGGSDVTCANLDFDGGQHNPLVLGLPALVCLRLRDVPGLQPALHLLFAETDQQRCGSRVLADRMLEVVLIQMVRWIIDYPERAGVPRGLISALSDPRLARAVVAVHQSPSEDWTLRSLAQVAAMSRSAFAESFKKAMGTTPAAYLTTWRLTVAASMLRSGRPINAVASDLGFASTSSLSKGFRRLFGLSPRGWLATVEAPSFEA